MLTNDTICDVAMVFALKVIAPATLDEGYSFDVTVDGRMFRVEVPDGGVQAGEEFVVHDSQENVAATKEVSATPDDAPRGRWRNNMFSCFDTMFTSTFWIAFLCPIIQTAQLMTGFNLDWLARDATPENVRRTFVASIIVFLVFWTFLGWFAEIIVLYLIFYLFVQTRLRRKARIQYEIPGNIFIDFVCTLFCSCCSSIQMVRQTHDEKEFPYDGCAVDGLPMWATPLERTETSTAVEETNNEGSNSIPPPSDDLCLRVAPCHESKESSAAERLVDLLLTSEYLIKYIMPQ